MSLNKKDKLMKIRTLIVVLPLILLSCKKDKEVITDSDLQKTDVSVSVSAVVKNDSVSVTESGLKLDKFGFPPEVEGCSCYFAESKADFEAERFVYVDDYGNNAFIKIENKLVKIPMEEGDFDPANFQKSIENADFKVLMKGKKIKEMEEVMMFSGEMTVENKKTGLKTTTPVYGECGC